MEHADLSRTASTRRIGLALALFVAPWLLVVANTARTITTLHGGDGLPRT